jgi:hypothetical protein
VAVEVQADLLVEDGVDRRILNVADLTALPDGAATEQTLNAILGAIQGGLTVPPAANASGAETVTQGATADLAVVPTAPAGYRLRGMAVDGDGDGHFELVIDGALVLSTRTRFHRPSVLLMLPNPVPVDEGAAVTVRVTNEADGTASYEGFILGEVIG